MLRNAIFQAIMEPKMWVKYKKNHIPCRGLNVVKNTSKTLNHLPYNKLKGDLTFLEKDTHKALLEN